MFCLVPSFLKSNAQLFPVIYSIPSVRPFGFELLTCVLTPRPEELSVCAL